MLLGESTKAPLTGTGIALWRAWVRGLEGNLEGVAGCWADRGGWEDRKHSAKLFLGLEDTATDVATEDWRGVLVEKACLAPPGHVEGAAGDISIDLAIDVWAGVSSSVSDPVTEDGVGDAVTTQSRGDRLARGEAEGGSGGSVKEPGI